MKLVLVLLALATPAWAQQPGWEVRVPERLEVKVGATVQLPIAIAVDRGLTVSRDAPVIVDLAPDAPVSVKRRRLGRTDAVDPGADAPRFDVTVRGDAAGEAVVKLRVRIWLCGQKSCKPTDLRRHTVVTVVPTPG